MSDPSCHSLRAWARAGLMLVLLLTPASRALAQDGSPGPGGAGAADALVASARALAERGQWETARATWRRVLEMNPHRADAWFGLAQASERTGDDAAARDAYARYLAAGGAAPNARTIFGADSPPEVAYRIATLHARAQRHDSTLAWIQRALALGLRNRARVSADSNFIALRRDPRFTRLGPPSGARPRDAARRGDVQYLVEEVHRVHRGPGPIPATFDSAATALLARVGRLTDNAFVVEMQRLLTLVGDGHTTFVPEGYGPWRATLPVLFESFADSIFIMAADAAHASLLGARITRVGPHAIARVLVRLDSLASRDNTQGVLRARVRNLRFPQLLHGLGLLPSDSQVVWTVVLASGRDSTATLTARPSSPRYSRFAGDSGWLWIDARAPGPVPLSRRDVRSPYWFTLVPGTGTVYLAFNSVVDDPRESLAQFAERLLRFIDSSGAERLVVDLRANNGGNSRLLQPLTDGIAASRVNRPGRLYVLTGRYTYSAGMNAATFLERHTTAIFAGEPTPSNPNFVGESNVFLLPGTALPVSISDLYWQSSWPFDTRSWIAPANYFPPTRAALESRRDPALEAVLQAPLPERPPTLPPDRPREQVVPAGARTAGAAMPDANVRPMAMPVAARRSPASSDTMPHLRSPLERELRGADR